MNFVFVLIVISTLIVGLNCFAEPDQPQIAASENESQDQPLEEKERLGYVHTYPGSVINRPPVRAPPSPTSLNLIECYTCTDCAEILGNVTTKLCPYSMDPVKQSKCVVYAEQYRYIKKPFYIRGCASERGSCSDIRKAHSSHTDIMKLLNCYECEGDRCNTNSASLSLVDVTMAFFAMVVTPLVAKYTLS